MFGHPSEPSRIYRYRARMPIQGIEIIEEQLRAAHQYRNALVALEHRRREAIRQALQQAMPTGVAWQATVEMLEAALEARHAVLARQHAHLRRREISAEAKAAAKSIKMALREARQHLQVLRYVAAGQLMVRVLPEHPPLQAPPWVANSTRLATCRRRVATLEAHAWHMAPAAALERAKRRVARNHPAAERLGAYESHRCQVNATETHPVLAAIDAATGDALKDLRRESGCFWGTYLAVEQGMQAARSGPPPKFRRYDLQGKLCVQIQHGLSPDELHSMMDPRLQLKRPVLDERGRIRRADRLSLCRIRIASVGRAPVWAEVPVYVSRPLPEDAQVKWAYLVRRRVATHLYWEIELVLARAGGWPKPDAARDGAVGIDPGYRRRPHGLRVMYWLGEDHHGGELVLPEDLLRKWAWVFELQAIRQRRMNAMLRDLVAWSQAHGRPEWWPPSTRSLAHWRRPALLAALASRWRREHPDDAPEMLAEIEAWRALDRRRYEEQEQLRRYLIDARDALYREAAVQLRRRYRTAVIEDTDWAELARREEAEEVRRLPAIVGRYRQIAAPSRLVQIMRESFAESLAGPSAYSTQRCAVCGQLMGIRRTDGRYVPVDARPKDLRCRSCGTTQDQDRNAARNFRDAAPALLARGAR